MSESLDKRVAEAMAHLKSTEAAAVKARSELEAASLTEYSADRAVRVTVGGKGEVTSLEFLDGKYRGMAASQLAASVLEAANAARAAMARRVVDTLDPLTKLTPRGMAPERMGVDWSSVFGSLLGDTSEEKESTAMTRLRDEIHEDEEEPGIPPGRGTKNKRQESE